MLTLGIDLAAQAMGTFGAVVDWSGGRARVVRLHRKLGDQELIKVATAEDLAVVGVDVPFGWPIAFVDFLAGAGTARSWTDDAPRLRLRETDRYCKQVTGKDPLSVSSDRIAAPAMRWRLLAPRIGPAAQRICEVYPAAALKVWALGEKPYKTREPEHRAARAEMLSAMRAELLLDMSEDDAACFTASADPFDALVAALVARAVALGDVHPIPRGLELASTREGWIQLPSRPLRSLRC